MSERRKPKTSNATASRRAVMRPRDAATLVIVDRTRSTPRILMGRRRPDQVFLPDTFVFPGGRVEAADRTLARTCALTPREALHLQIAMRGRASDVRAAALALAAVRETFEETGLIVGEPGNHDPRGKIGGWDAFLAEGFRPRLDGLAFFARAVTPPGRPRRYDTRFFLADARGIAHRIERTDGELLDIDWFTLEQAKRLKLPSITHYVIEDISAVLNRPRHRAQASAIPYYANRYGRFERQLLELPRQARKV